jgi:hypothetical protein
MRVKNDIDLFFETVKEEEKKEENDLPVVPLDDQCHRFHDPLSRDQNHTEKQQDRHGTFVGVSFSMHIIATMVLVLLIASQGSLLYCCRMSVHIRNELVQQQHSQIQQYGSVFHKKLDHPHSTEIQSQCPMGNDMVKYIRQSFEN